jgi:hypothetical protein
MKSALARGLWTAALAIALIFALGEIVTVLTGGDWLAFIEHRFSATLIVGAIVGIKGYGSHPSARGIPIPVNWGMHVENSLDRFVPRIGIGLLLGAFGLFSIIGAAVWISSGLDGNGRLHPNLAAICAFAICGAATSAFSAAVAGALVVPPGHDKLEICKATAWSTLCGVPVGAVRCSVSAFLSLGLASQQPPLMSELSVLGFTAIDGLIAGVGAALLIRFLMNKHPVTIDN